MGSIKQEMRTISIRVDLITGFLGAGKTTFLLRYARYLMARGQRIGILVYDHGAMNVDLPLLNELRGLNCELETVAGACDADCHRRRFRTRLIAMAMSGYDRVIIEPSGVFDMDEFFDTLQDPPLDRQYDVGNIIAIIDANLEENFSEEEDFYLASQSACAGRVVLSKVQLASPAEIGNTLRHLRRAEEKIRSRLTPDEAVLIKTWDDLTEEDFADLASCGYQTPDYVKTIAGTQTEFQSLSFLDLPLEGTELLKKTALLFSDTGYGRIVRVKGFFRDGKKWYQLNATAQKTKTEEIPETRGAIIIIGTALNENEINRLLTGRIPEHRIL
jgi:G3E family GTPase